MSETVVDDAELHALLGVSENPWKPSRGTLIAGVVRSTELLRIFNLPRRAESVEPEVIEALTEHLKTDEIRAWDAIRADHPGDWRLLLPEGRSSDVDAPEAPQRLRPIQARALADGFEQRGLFAPIGVGHGKFLISTLIVTLVEDSRARRGEAPGRWLLLVPANLYRQTMLEIARLRRHWRLPKLWPDGPLRVETYEKLSSAKASKFLDDDVPKIGQPPTAYLPTDIVCDEIHKLKRATSARVRRFLRYFRAHQSTHLYGMSGTITRKTLRDYWHLLHLALPKCAPLPRGFQETEAWSQALDDAPDDNLRRAPGALLDFCDAAEIEEMRPGWRLSPDEVRLGYYGESDEDQAKLLSIVRRGFRRRLVETPGVVGTSEGAIGTSLVISERIPPPVPPEVREAFRTLRTTWQTPNGDEIDGGVSMWRHACELASGFWYRWDPAAPMEWLVARQDWNRFVRYVLAHNRQKLDSPLQVWQAVESGKLSEAFGPELALELQGRWRQVRDSFVPNAVPQWISSWLVDDVIAWFAEQRDDDTGKELPGIAWVTHSAVGDAIALASGGRIPYFGGGPEASTKILTHKGPCVVSIAAHGTGKNLQRFSRNLVVHPPSGGDVWEQLLGRTHRPGQEADEVRVDVYLHALELRKALESGRRVARYIEDTTRQVQKLTYATVTTRSDEEIESFANALDPLWFK